MANKARRRSKRQRSSALKALLLLPFMDLSSQLPGNTQNHRRTKTRRMIKYAQSKIENLELVPLSDDKGDDELGSESTDSDDDDLLGRESR